MILIIQIQFQRQKFYLYLPFLVLSTILPLIIIATFLIISLIFMLLFIFLFQLFLSRYYELKMTLNEVETEEEVLYINNRTGEAYTSQCKRKRQEVLYYYYYYYYYYCCCCFHYYYIFIKFFVVVNFV